MSIPSKILNINDFKSTEDFKNYIIIDVRSPAEYEEDHIPESINQPVLNDDERAEVGTVYKQISPFKAREMGAGIISRNISGIISHISELALLRKPFLIYCWRGGMRSKSLFTVMEMIGYKSFLLEGGYKAYRKTVHKFLEEGAVQHSKNFLEGQFLSIHGYTGSGKTDLLYMLNDQYSIIDLEKAAVHRGSFLGSYKNRRQPAQKQFETDLFFQIRNQKSNNYVLEGESRKIGKLTVPLSIWNKMQEGRKIWVDLPLSFRIENSVKNYKDDIEHINDKLFLLEERLGASLTGDIRQMLESGNLAGAAEILLREYYDPLYHKHSPENNRTRYHEVIQAENLTDLYEKVKQYLKTISF